MEKLGPWADRVSSDRAIGVEVIALRAGGKEQLDHYKLLQENVWAMIQEGFSEKIIQVGKTTADDLVWWFREVMVWRVSTSLLMNEEQTTDGSAAGIENLVPSIRRDLPIARRAIGRRSPSNA